MSRIRQILQDRLAEVERQLGPLQVERDEIRRALAAMDSGSPIQRRRLISRKTLSIPMLAQEALRAHPEGLRTAQLVEVLAAEHGREVSRRNMSWYLSNLKREGRLRLENELWKLRASTD